MCAIRLIRRTSGSQLSDQVIELKDINVNPLDRPAYVVYVNNGKSGMEFFFTSDKEERAKCQFNDIYIEYGVNSGRIYVLITNKNDINQTDAFHIINESRTDSSTERFKENIKSFIAISNQVLEFTINNPV